MPRARDIGSLRRSVNDLLGDYVVAGLNVFGKDKLELLTFEEDVDRVVEALVTTCGFRMLKAFKPYVGESIDKLCLSRWRRETWRERVSPVVVKFTSRAAQEFEREMEADELHKNYESLEKRWDSEDNTVDDSPIVKEILTNPRGKYVTFSESSTSNKSGSYNAGRAQTPQHMKADRAKTPKSATSAAPQPISTLSGSPRGSSVAHS